MSDFPDFVAGRKAPNSARQWQTLSDAGRSFANLQVQPPLTLTRTGRIATLGMLRERPAGATHQTFRLTGIRGDYLEAVALDGVTTALIAKPYLLRRTPFDNGVEGARTDPPPPERIVDITYEYADNVTRVAIEAGDPNADPPVPDTREDQIIIPQYVGPREAVYTGDLITAVRMVFGGTGVVTEAPPPDQGPPEGIAVNWIDLNIDGREWAKVS